MRALEKSNYGSSGKRDFDQVFSFSINKELNFHSILFDLADLVFIFSLCHYIVSNFFIFEGGSEGRLRLGERQGQGVLQIESESRKRAQERNSHNISNSASEGRLRSTFQSNVIPNQSEGKVRIDIASNISIPSSEARLRVGDAFSGRGSSLHDHITPTHSVGPSPESHSPVQSISAALSGSYKSQTSSKNAMDNPYEQTGSDKNPFGDEFETEDMGINNPFEDDYDDKKNPFADDASPKHKAEDSGNPFGDDDDEELDPTNPFS